MSEVSPLKSAFYYIERAIKEYRKYAQSQISNAVPDITLDQALVLVLVNNDEEYSQTELSQLLFKDFASLTRMIELLVKNGFLIRSVNKNDRRRTNLKLTTKGKTTIEILTPIIFQNRKNALESITDDEIDGLKSTLSKITNNCKNKS